MASTVQETLRGLCYDTEWCYAVFWRLKQQMHNLLAWEEGFYEPSCQGQYFCLDDDRIGKAVERMSCHIYPVGEGIIGKVASTNEHQWILSSQDREYPAGLHDQFAAGIQTIAVISVHLGVVQLGSTLMISEDLKLVAHVKELFGALHNIEGMDSSGLESQREGMYRVDSHTTTIASDQTARIPAISDVWSNLAARGRHLKDDQGLHKIYSPLQSTSFAPLDLQRSTLMSSLVPSHQGHRSMSMYAFIPSERSTTMCSSVPSPQQRERINSQAQPAHSLLHKLGLDSLVQHSSSSLTNDEAAMATNATGKGESAFTVETIHHSSFDATPPTVFWPLDHWDMKPCPLLQSSFTDHLALPIEACADGGKVASTKYSGTACSGITTQAHVQNILAPTAESPLLMHHSCGARDETLHNEAINYDSSVNNKSNTQNSLLAVQRHNMLDKHDIGEFMFSERIFGEDQDLSSLLCDNVQHSLEIIHKETKACPEGLSDDELQRVFSSELDEFDNFLASLKKEQEKQDNGSTKSSFASTLLEEVSEVSDRSIPKASFWDPPTMQGSSQSALERRPVVTQPVDFSSLLKEETSTSCQSAESDALHLERFWKRPRLESIHRSSESSTVPGSHNRVLGLSATVQDEPLQAGKKRARPGENPRPRPKDRQQIQDRVRELRTIIPSSAKCSIDALLEKTIKYMNFLQAMAEDADKLKDGKLQDFERHGDSNIREGGASWAVELGGQGRGCPLIVEDLSQPRHMLVEMLCEETGIFLEIADTIRGLGLTILKGLMESRNEKTWARFVVKANEGVQRFHIMWSLMQLLEPNTRNPSNVTNLPCG